MNYTIKDAKEVAIASFVSTLFFFALKRGDTIQYPYISPIVSLIITFVWINLYTNHTYSRSKIIPTLTITIVVCTISALIFNLISIDQIFNFNFFGSIAIVATWMAFPLAMLFERLNITNPIITQHIGKHSKKN